MSKAGWAVIVVIALGLGLDAGSRARAALGMREDALTAVFGAPVSSEDAGLGDCRLTFSKRPYTVIVHCRENVVTRITYRKPDLSKADVSEKLRENGAGHDWHLWEAPGSAGATGSSGTVRWLRADEGAMAIFVDGELSILSGEENRPSAATNGVARVGASVAVPASSGKSRELAARAPALARPPREPEPAPARPAEVPRDGDSRAEALRILGRPAGMVVAGPVEILNYNWGRVYLRDGKVTGVY